MANSLLVVMNDPGDVVRGTLTVSANLYNAPIAYTLAVQYSVAGANSWTTLCQGLVTTSQTCTWNTTAKAFTSGESYDFRAVATAGATVVTSAVVADVLVDNTAPTVSMADPGSPLRGTVTLAASAADADGQVRMNG